MHKILEEKQANQLIWRLVWKL